MSTEPRETDKQTEPVTRWQLATLLSLSRLVPSLVQDPFSRPFSRQSVSRIPLPKMGWLSLPRKRFGGLCLSFRLSQSHLAYGWPKANLPCRRRMCVPLAISSRPKESHPCSWCWWPSTAQGYRGVPACSLSRAPAVSTPALDSGWQMVSGPRRG
ncbi:hypothetical protein LY76DRAFT_596636 [Colletotrichum caudatum]|nr:hypothetical protein LY76DRAFT_596636 [Colletotrichum caudatum]